MNFINFLNPSNWFNRNNSTGQLDPLDDRFFDSNSGFMFSNRTQSLQESTVFSCVRVLSDAIAQLPCRLFNDSEGKNKTATGNPLYQLLLNSPNGWMTSFDYWKYNIISQLSSGFFLSRVIRGDSGKILSLIPCDPKSTKMKLLRDGSILFETKTVIDLINKVKTTISFTSKEAFYCPYATNDGFTPISPIKENMLTIKLGSQMRQDTSNFLDNGSTPQGVLQTDKTLNDVALKRLKESWNEKHGGINKGGTAILEEGMQFKAIRMNNQEIQFLELRQFTKEEICGMFGVPVHMISDTKQAKGWSTVEHQQQEFIALGLNPIMVKIEKSITKYLIPKGQRENTFADFDTKALLRGDLKARTEYYKYATPNGVLSVNEVRIKEGLPPREGGDDFKTPLNLTTDITDDTNSEEFEDEHN